MKQLGILLLLCMGWVNTLWAVEGKFLPQYAKPVIVQVFSDRNGAAEEEDFQLNPREYCFVESFYCFMNDGQCFCPLLKCEEWPDGEPRAHWMVIRGTNAERVCGRAPALYDLTNICQCSFDKNPPCDACNVPPKSPVISCEEWMPLNYSSWIPEDCRHR